MLDFNFYSPTYFAFGKGREKETGKLVKRFGGSKVLIIYGGGSVVKSGLLQRVEASLKEEKIDFVELGGVHPNPKSGFVYKGIETCKGEGTDFLLPVGGGSVIDTAKAIAAGSLYNGDFWDFFSGKKQIEMALPIGTVLTIPAAGSEGSANTVITNEDGNIKRGTGAEALRPKFSIMNPELTFTLPPYQTACGITDMLAHVQERYFTNTKNVDLTDRLCEAVMKTIIAEAPKVLKNPEDYEARANIMWAGTVAHNDSLGIGREQDWATHQLEHELSGLYDIAHGAGLAVMFPAWMKFVYKHDVMRFAQYAVKVWNCEMNFQYPELTVLEGISCYEKFLQSIGMPTSFKEINAREEDIPQLVENLGLDKRQVGFFVRLTKESAAEIYRLAL